MYAANESTQVPPLKQGLEPVRRHSFTSVSQFFPVQPSLHRHLGVKKMFENCISQEGIAVLRIGEIVSIYHLNIIIHTSQ